jgi:protoheme IX farnesyltransferase
MCGVFYLVSALVLDAVFLYYVVRMLVDHRDELAKETFRYSIIYLTLLFIALFIDHYLPLFAPLA